MSLEYNQISKAIMKKVYKVVAMTTYIDRVHKYTCGEFTKKTDALKYMKDNCYETASRSYYIEECF